MTCLVLQAGYQPIPGYVLRNKLGAGGYGEVWSADAPGGLTKAIKVVFGNVDDQRGATELKSLNRMRKLNHPFLLSIERVEIVESQLVIVTELAQGSLLDRLLEYREKGYIGIPQERLMRYFADAADGLDYLCQEHNLQHLDVKPGNLLLVADRVKVADFGLIKNLQSMTQSIRQGLTPVYAAPEMFDGRPSPSSDQYSLAITYIELLSGNLPFRGRTFAQLASEHLNKAPNLDSIPVIERPILSKALSKKPIMRFGSCREFVRALEECRNERKAPAARPRSRSPGSEYPSRKQGNSTESKDASQAIDLPPADSSKIEAKPLRLLPPLPPLAPSDKPTTQKVLCIGLGGSGGLAIQTLRMRYEQSESDETPGARPRTLYIDTDSDAVEQLTSLRNLHAIPYDDTLLMRLNSAQYFRQNSSSDLNRISRRWIFNIPRSQKTEGVRPLGMLAFLDHSKECYDTLARVLEDLAEDEDVSIKVYLMASAHGGTGGAIVSEVGYLIRQIASVLNVSIEIQVTLLCASLPEKSTADLMVASAVTCLEEIAEHSESGGLHEPLQSIPHHESFEQVPFDHVTLVYGGVLGKEHDWSQSVENMVDYVRSQEQSDLGQRFGELRASSEETPGDTALGKVQRWLSVVGFRRLNLPSQYDALGLANRGCLDAFRNWVTLTKKQISDIEYFDIHRKFQKEAQPEIAWTNELLRGQQLSANIWVRRVIGSLALLNEAPRTNVADPMINPSREEIAVDWKLAADEIEDIEAIASQLNFDPEKAKIAVLDLLYTSHFQLWCWIEQSALSSFPGWKHFGTIVGQIEQRLESNVEQITSIAKLLKEKRDSMLEEMYSSNTVRVSEIDLTLETLSLEIRFHVLAAKLGFKLARKLREIRGRWLKQSIRTLEELKEIATKLMTDLGIQPTGFEEEDDASGLILNPFYCDAIRHLRDFTHFNLSECWSLPPEVCQRFEPECTDLGELVRMVVASTSTHATKTHSPDRGIGNRKSTIPVDKNFFQDRFGWNAIFRGANSGENSEELVGKGEIKDASQIINANFTDEFRRALPKLMRCGGAVRNVLMIGNRVEAALEPEHFQQVKNSLATTINDPIATRCSIFSVGEQVDLSELIKLTWSPNPNIRELSRRLRSTITEE
jgi:serine/threonine protein kinase/uncharacterized protein YjiS (DUF1127 family)